MVICNIFQLDKNMREIGNIIIKMDMELFIMLMVINIKEIGSKTKNKEKENLHLLMAQSTKGNFLITIFKVMVR